MTARTVIGARVAGRPAITARFRQVPEDFVVEELLGWVPDGEGEHLYLKVRKRGVTTAEVMRRIAEAAGVAVNRVSHAGLKDRQGVCIQWLSVHLPGRQNPDWSSIGCESLTILEQRRNRRRLRIGTHAGNLFSIVLRQVRDPDDELAGRIERIVQKGVPNYFGEQRFGRDNVRRVFDWFETGRPPRGRLQRSLLLSSARALLFNRLLSWRVEQGSWDRALEGDRMMLAGSNSHFPASAELHERLLERLQSGDIHPGGPLWGAAQSDVSGEAQLLEQRLATEFPELCRGLEEQGLKMQRRSLRLLVPSLCYRLDDDQLHLTFELPPGTYATAVLREICHYSEDGPLAVAGAEDVEESAI